MASKMNLVPGSADRLGSVLAEALDRVLDHRELKAAAEQQRQRGKERSTEPRDHVARLVRGTIFTLFYSDGSVYLEYGVDVPVTAAEARHLAAICDFSTILDGNLTMARPEQKFAVFGPEGVPLPPPPLTPRRIDPMPRDAFERAQLRRAQERETRIAELRGRAPRVRDRALG